MNAVESLRAKGWQLLNGQWYAPDNVAAKAELKRLAALATLDEPKPVKPIRRLRQDKPPNKLEAAWIEVLKERYPDSVIHAQAMRFKLASGAWYKPDACLYSSNCRWIAWETKFLKGKNAARGILALKCAAHQFPEICFVLVWKDEAGQWREEIVKP